MADLVPEAQRTSSVADSLEPHRKTEPISHGGRQNRPGRSYSSPEQAWKRHGTHSAPKPYGKFGRSKRSLKVFRMQAEGFPGPAPDVVMPSFAVGLGILCGGLRSAEGDNTNPCTLRIFRQDVAVGQCVALFWGWTCCGRASVAEANKVIETVVIVFLFGKHSLRYNPIASMLRLIPFSPAANLKACGSDVDFFSKWRTLARPNSFHFKMQRSAGLLDLRCEGTRGHYPSNGSDLPLSISWTRLTAALAQAFSVGHIINFINGVI